MSRYPDGEGCRYRKCRGTVIFHSSFVRGYSDATSSEGVASSRSRLDPHCCVIQSGASRSVSPWMLCREIRLWDWRKRGSWVESWYLSANIVDGRVRYVCKEQVVSGGSFVGG